MTYLSLSTQFYHSHLKREEFDDYKMIFRCASLSFNLKYDKYDHYKRCLVYANLSPDLKCIRVSSSRY